jgi:hypothetical protein
VHTPRTQIHPRLSRDAIVRDLRALARRVGRPLLNADLADQPRLLAAVLRHFGRLQSALKVAGLPSPVARPKWSRERVINELRQLHQDGIKLTASGIQAAGRGGLVEAALKYAGGLEAARKLAGFPSPPGLSRARIIAEIREHIGAGNVALPTRLRSASVTYFGSTRAARTAAGVPPRAPGKWSKERLIERLQQCMARGESVDSTLYYVCYRYFGSVTAAKQAAGLPVRVRWSRARLLDAVRRYVRLYPQRAIPSAMASLCRSYLGSVARARAAVGTEPLRRRWSKQAIIFEIRKRVARGEPLDGRLYAATYRYFDSIPAAREAARVRSVTKLREPRRRLTTAPKKPAALRSPRSERGGRSSRRARSA